MITKHMLVKNHEHTIERALQSIAGLDGEILVADLGCTDDSVEICRDFNAQIFKTKGPDRSKIRNKLVEKGKFEWQFYIEPWEVLTEDEPIRQAVGSEGSLFDLQVLQGDLITKETRLWQRSEVRFVNPVFESLQPSDGAVTVACTIYSTGSASNEAEQAFELWRKEGLVNDDRLYYEACWLLTNQRWDDFLAMAEAYILGKKKPEMSVIMTKYYCSVVYSAIKKDSSKALKHILECISVKPLMAEFWCQLGDIHYYCTKEVRKAETFYDNARILGTRRLHADKWPMIISKYSEYPDKMIDSCKKIRQETHAFGTKR